MTLRFLKQKTPRFSCRVAYCKVGTDLLSQGRVAAYQQFGFIQRVLSLFKISSRSSVFGILGKDRRKIDRGGKIFRRLSKLRASAFSITRVLLLCQGRGFLLCQGVQDARISETAADIIRRRVMESILSCGLFVVVVWLIVTASRQTTNNKMDVTLEIITWILREFR